MSRKYASDLHRVEKNNGWSCLVTWREYEGENDVLVQVGINVEVRPGDASFFYTTHIVHHIEETWEKGAFRHCLRR
jgi:hypothetical protein